jgi:hypothetical protein
MPLLLLRWYWREDDICELSSGSSLDLVVVIEHYSSSRIELARAES